MPKYRHELSQFRSATVQTDGGLETVLIFQRGLDLPQFAAFPLLETREGRSELESYFDDFLSIDNRHGIGFILDAPTWRANADWVQRLGYDRKALGLANLAGIEFIETLRQRYESPRVPCVLNGVIGHRGDGYLDGNMEPAAAEDYHAFQVEIFADTEADMVSALTMNNTGEATVIAGAAKLQSMPCVISFTVETDGRLVNGTSLQKAIETVDEATDGSPIYYIVNCAHPTHFADAFDDGGTWVERIASIRANA